MNLAEKFRETALSVLPVTVIVLLLGSTAAPIGASALGAFCVGALLLTFGLTVFLLGVDLGIEPMGERTGAALVGRRSLPLLLAVAFAIGFVVTAAEPDIQVFGDQVRGVLPAVGKLELTLSIAAGVGAFLLVGLLRIVLSLPVKAMLLACYVPLAIAAIAAKPEFVGVAFDSGGATTGPMTVPFILALGVGVAAMRGHGEGGFGLTGVASAGPVLAVLLYSFCLAESAEPVVSEATHAEGVEVVSHAEVAEAAEVVSHAEVAEAAEVVSHAEVAEAAEVVSHAEVAEAAEVVSHAEVAEVVSHAESAENAEIVSDSAMAESPRRRGRAVLRRLREPVSHAARESIVSILPLFCMFVFFRRRLLKMSARQAARLAIGFLYALIGLFVFLLGVNGGFMQAGAALGEALGAKAAAGGAGAWALLIGSGLAFGAIIVCAEPAVWVLSEQVESLSGGAIKRRALLVFLSVGTAAAIGLAMWRAVAGFPLWWILAPGYALALLLMARSPSVFTAIAFDSGGVASGPLTSTFVLSFALGAASRGSGGSDSFGVIALVAMMPLVALQAMGILYDRGRRKALGAAAASPAPARPDPVPKEGAQA